MLIDDIDSTFINSEDMHCEDIYVFLCVQVFSPRCANLYLRTSVRTDVWSSLRKNEDLDKFEQYVIDIHWNKNELHAILAKKILTYCERHFLSDTRFAGLHYSRDAGKILQFVFRSRLRWGNANVPPFTPISIFSAKRPCWMAQLCRLAGMRASQLNIDRIGTSEINQVMPTFGRMRLNDLYKEHDHQFADLQNLVEVFGHGSRRYSTRDLLWRIETEYVNLRGRENIPPIEGFPFSSPLQLAYLLFEAGFILGRRAQEKHPDLADLCFTRSDLNY